MYQIIDVDEFVGEMLKLRDEIVSIDKCVEEEHCSNEFIHENLRYVELHLCDIIEKHIVKAEEIHHERS